MQKTHRRSQRSRRLPIKLSSKSYSRSSARLISAATATLHHSIPRLSDHHVVILAGLVKALIR